MKKIVYLLKYKHLLNIGETAPPPSVYTYDQCRWEILRSLRLIFLRDPKNRL